MVDCLSLILRQIRQGEILILSSADYKAALRTKSMIFRSSARHGKSTNFTKHSDNRVLGKTIEMYLTQPVATAILSPWTFIRSNPAAFLPTSNLRTTGHKTEDPRIETARHHSAIKLPAKACSYCFSDLDCVILLSCYRVHE